MKICQLLKTILSYCPIVGFMVVLSSLAFEYSTVQQIALIWTGATYVLDFVINQRWIGWQLTKDKWVFIVCMAFFLLLPIWVLMGIETGPRVHSFMETYLPFAILGAVGLCGMPKTARVEWFATVALATFSAVAVYMASQVGWNVFEHIHSMANHFNYYRAMNLTSHMHFNLYANMGLVLAVAALQKPDLHRAWRIVLYILMAITVTIVFISDGRTGLLTMMLILGFSVIHALWKRNKVVALVLAVLCSAAAGAVVMHSIQAHYATVSDEPRQYIWAVAIDQIKEHPWLGYGPSAGHEQFVDRGIANEDFMTYYGFHLMQLAPDRPDEVIRMAHPHNVILETWIGFGLVGVVLLLLLFILPVVTNRPPYRFPLFLCSMTYFVQGMFEKMGCDLNPLLWLIVLLLLSVRIGDEQADGNA